jgi:hypothetical protein
MNPVDEFLMMVACICLNESNFDAAQKVEKILQTPGTLMSIFNRNRFGHFNKSTFLHKGFQSDVLLFQLFYPHPNQLFVEHMMGLHKENQVLLIFLAEQYHAQQVWQAYFAFAADYHVITHSSVKKLSKENKPLIENCLLRNKLFENKFIPSSNSNILLKLASIFTSVLPKRINVDIVKGDGNCFFTSITNQFLDFVEDENMISNQTIRLNIQDYCKQNFDEFIESAVSIWKIMFESDPTNQEWGFFLPYQEISDKREIGKKMLRDKMFLKSSFFAESFTMALTVEYLNYLLKRKLMIIVVDVNNQPFPVLGHTELGSENMYTFLLKEPLHYSSLSINEQRVFTRRNLPKLNFKFLEHLEF